MKKTLAILALFLGLSSSHADLPPSDLEKSYLASAKNRLFNPGFEQGLAGWTASVPSTLTLEQSASEVWDGKSSMKFTSTSTGQTVTSRVFNFPSNQAGVTYTISCRYKTTNSDYVMRAIDDSGNDLHAVTSVYNMPASPGYSRWTISFGTPSSGGVRLRFTSASAGTIRADDCYGGIAEGFNSSISSQSGLFGGVTQPVTANCEWPSTATSYADFPADADCPTPTGIGLGTAPSTKIPGVTFPYLPPGDYLVMTTIKITTGGGPTNAKYRWHDGTNPAQEEWNNSVNDSVGAQINGRFSYSEPKFNITFRLQGSRTGGTSLGIDNTTVPFQILVYRYPSSNEQSFKLESQPFFGGILTTVSASDSSVSSSGVWENVDSANWATKTLFGSATAGTTSTHLSFRMPYLPAGTYELCANYSIASTQGIGCYAAMFDGTNRITSFADQNQVSAVQEGRALGCGAVTYTSPQTNLEFSIQMRNNSGTSNCSVEGSLVASTGGYKNFYIKSMGVTVPIPVTPGGVVTKATGTLVLEAGLLTSSSSPAVVSQSSPSWITGSTGNGTGSTVWTMGGFVSTPWCGCTSEDSNRRCSLIVNSATQFTTYRFNGSETAENGNVNAWCFGFK